MRAGCPALCLLIVANLLGCVRGSIVRVRAGHSYEEHAIDTRAYAAYAKGRLYELRGDLMHAVEQYQRVLSMDPEATAAWVRLGVIDCVTAPNLAQYAWQQAEQLDPESPQLWLERARCESNHERDSEALHFALLAIRFDPSSVEAVSVITSAASKLHRPSDGLKWLWGAAAMNPANVSAWQALQTSSHVPASDRRYAAAQLAKLRPPDASAFVPTYSSATNSTRAIHAAWTAQWEQELEHSLGTGDIAVTRRLATLLGVNPVQLARRALLSGAYEIAWSQADMILNIDSTNASAWIVGLAAADRLGDSRRYLSMLHRAPRVTVAVEESLRSLLFDLVQNRVTTSIDLR
jgi:hypothetical protein